jgi:hypothetical protein
LLAHKQLVALLPERGSSVHRSVSLTPKKSGAKKKA